MTDYNYDKFLVALRERITEIRLDIKRTERSLADLYEELEKAQTAIENVEREHMRSNDKY